MSKTWSGLTTREYKKHKGLTKENLRDNMTNIELLLNALAEETATEISKERNPQGLTENARIAKEGAGVAKALCDKGFLTSYGFGRGTKYQINEEYELSSLQNDDSKGVRSSSEKVKKDILEVCSDYASIEEIASKVGKSIVYLKNKIIPQMLKDGLLEWQYPNAPRHPYQKYRTKK